AGQRAPVGGAGRAVAEAGARCLGGAGAAAAGAAVRTRRGRDTDALRVARLAAHRPTVTGERPEAGIGDVVGALVGVDDAVVRVRILGQLAPLVEEAGAAGAPVFGAGNLALGRDLRREVVVGREADLVLALRGDAPRRRVELDALVAPERWRRLDLGRIGGRQAGVQVTVGVGHDPGLGSAGPDPGLHRGQLLGGEGRT